MPRGDGTGPDGMGAMTGRGAGYCNGFDRPGYAQGGRGRRNYGFFGRGFGGRAGRGFNGFWNPPVRYQYSETDEKQYLENEITSLKDVIKNLEKRLADLAK